MTGPVHDPVLAGFGAWLARAARLFPALARDRERLERDLDRVRGLGERIEAPLAIVLAGGTGTGKSTLLNALAGAEIAATSEVRPCTREATCYVHSADEIAIPPEIAGARRVAHERPELRHKVVVDAPDFDGTVPENVAALKRALAGADLVLVLATQEKYAAAALFALLSEYRDGRSFAFVLNKLDREGTREVARDFRRELERAGFGASRLLLVSALSAFRRKRGEAGGGRDSEGDFAQLEALIERELTRARIREMKRLNLDALTARLLEAAAARLPEGRAAALARWRESAEGVCDEARAKLAGALARAVREDEGLREEARARIAAGYGGPFGFYQALVWGVRRLAAWRPAAAPFAAARPALGALAAGEETVLARAVALAARRMGDLGEEHGVRADGVPIDEAGAGELVSAARREAERAIDGALGALRTRPPPAGRRLESLALNAAPVGVPLYALWRWIEAFAGGVLLDSSWFIAAFLIALIALAVEGRLADVLARRRAARLIGALEEAAAAASDARVARPLLSRLEAVLGEVEAAARELQSLREAAPSAAAASR